MSKAEDDDWLRRWLALVAERAAGLPILELGCGGGRDSAALTGAGHRLVGIDLSPTAVANARSRAPAGEFHVQDLRAPWPVVRTGVIVASLSLHYFPWPDTEALVTRIHDTLLPHGLLLCRLNSTNDHHHGASGHPRIDNDFYLVDGEPKRFFDEAAVDRLFTPDRWHTLAKAEGAIARYDRPKSVWEIAAERR